MMHINLKGTQQDSLLLRNNYVDLQLLSLRCENEMQQHSLLPGYESPYPCPLLGLYMETLLQSPLKI